MSNDKELQNYNASSDNLTNQLITKKFNSLPENMQNELAQKAAETKIGLERQVVEDSMRQRNAQMNVDMHIQAVTDMNHLRSAKGSDKITSDIKTTTGNMHIESKSGYCYVATATYDNINHPNVVLLRDFRDRYLCKTWPGRTFIYIYYAIGKYLAILPRHSAYIKRKSRKFLDNIVAVILKKYYM